MVASGREALIDCEHFFDGYKANPDYALACAKAAYQAGARWVVLCDTNGGTLPEEIEKIVTEVVKIIPGDRLGIHVHNDTDNGVANSLAAVRAGARQIQGTLNGLGERCGNANLTSIIPTLMLKSDYAERFETCVTPEKLRTLTHASRILDEMLNRAPNRHAPYVGESAFAHKGGIHVSAVQKDPRTYEHVPPEAVGNRRKLLVSDQAGRSNILAELERIGIVTPKDDPRIVRLLDEVKQREAQGYAYEAADASFELLARRMLGNVPQFFDVDAFRVTVERRHNALGNLVTVSEATVKVRIDGETRAVGRRGERPGQRAGQCAAQGSRPLSGLHRRSRTGRLQSAYPHGRHRRRHPRVDREPRRGGEPLVHGRRLAEYRRCLVRGADRLHQLQADPRRGARALTGPPLRICPAPFRVRLPRSISAIRIAATKVRGAVDRMMRGVAVALLLLFCDRARISAGRTARQCRGDRQRQWRRPRAGLRRDPARGRVGEAETGGDFCAGATGVGGYACRAGAFFFGSVERTVVTFMALLALSTLLLWFNTRKAVTAARIAAEHIPAVERAYVFGGPTDLFLLHDQASVRLAMQNYGKTPAVIKEWLVEFVAQEPRGKSPAYEATKRTVANEILEPDKLFTPAAVFRSEIAAPFFIVGYIAYEDVFRQAHTTRFCVGVARDGKAAYAGHPSWNGYD